MIEMSTTHEDVILVNCTGIVSVDGFEEIVDAEFDKIVGSGRRICFVLHLGGKFGGFGPGAWGDLTEDLLRTRFHRGAVVTDDDHLSASVNLLKWTMHGSLRTFHNNELDRALSWVAV